MISYSMAGWGLLIYLGVVTTALGYWLLILGTRYINATSASILTLIDPLVAAVLAYLLFGERLGFLGVLGGLTLLIAFVMISRRT